MYQRVLSKSAVQMFSYPGVWVGHLSLTQDPQLGSRRDFSADKFVVIGSPPCKYPFYEGKESTLDS